jgi:hypothetical protein
MRLRFYDIQDAAVTRYILAVVKNFPMQFRLSDFRNEKATHVGVAEFSSSERLFTPSEKNAMVHRDRTSVHFSYSDKCAGGTNQRRVSTIDW